MPPRFATPGLADKQVGTGAATATEETESSGFYDTIKPTCLLNPVCDRSSAKGCDLVQVHDDQFFREIRRLYTTEMCGSFRPYFSLKTLRAFRVLTLVELGNMHEIIRHAFESVEKWNTARIAVSGTVHWLASCLVGIMRSAMGGGPPDHIYRGLLYFDIFVDCIGAACDHQQHRILGRVEKMK
ncbi:hypothetical protein N657DRAFT_633220 [Parathielavia appendiculata]|uniref:Uncharacterized protein n=1 Tax=Parathielavia appendiculata TaxID=2587402 RepID=A0AAN6U2T3_9PEZI|nr:hypothetical protein N657DRAFT_633220 [Parathielavia appendiculata]